MSSLTIRMLHMGFPMSVQTFCAFWPIKIMTLTGSETKSNQEGEQSKTFHRTPLLTISPWLAIPIRLIENVSNCDIS